VDPTTVSRALLGEPVVVASSRATQSGAWQDPALRGGAADVVRLTARPSQLSRVALSFAFRQPLARIPVPTHQVLRRLAAHLESAARLRDAEAAAAQLVRRPSAASADAADAAARARVRAAVATTLRARTNAEQAALGARELWRGMVDGRWSLVDCYETDGRRVLLARANTPADATSRALTARERVVVEKLATGRRARQIAGDLGLRESTISETLSRALRKLGMRRQAELIELHSVLLPDHAA
jgi:DNA-binding NarL/FixJ family response regulator